MVEIILPASPASRAVSARAVNATRSTARPPPESKGHRRQQPSAFPVLLPGATPFVHPNQGAKQTCDECGRSVPPKISSRPDFLNAFFAKIVLQPIHNPAVRTFRQPEKH
jgi:hypothetical protein